MEHHANVYTFVEFCHAHRISRSTLYNLFGQGLGPRVMHVRGRRLISHEAAAAWRAQMEARTSREVQSASATQKVAQDDGEARK